MGKTISEKILARASELKEASAGEIVKAWVDVAMMPDLTTILAVKAMKAMGREKVWDKTPRSSPFWTTSPPRQH